MKPRVQWWLRVARPRSYGTSQLAPQKRRWIRRRPRPHGRAVTLCRHFLEPRIRCPPIFTRLRLQLQYVSPFSPRKWRVLFVRRSPLAVNTATGRGVAIAASRLISRCAHEEPPTSPSCSLQRGEFEPGQRPFFRFSDPAAVRVAPARAVRGAPISHCRSFLQQILLPDTSSPAVLC